MNADEAVWHVFASYSHDEDINVWVLIKLNLIDVSELIPHTVCNKVKTEKNIM